MAAFGIYGGMMASEFYPGRLGGAPKGKPLPKWFGRVWCFGFAAIAVYWGVRALP
jgi:hypothetical protein